MITMLKDWKGSVDINEKSYDSMKHAISDFKRDTEEIHIVLHSQLNNRPMSVETMQNETQYKITVKSYMTKKATPDFDFMLKWNNNNPMPLRIMQGTIEKETKGMVYMHLRGEGLRTVNCMRCGRELTNPISRQYGIGPECIHKIPMFADIDIEDVDNIKEQLVNVEWSGWIIKSAITQKEEV